VEFVGTDVIFFGSHRSRWNTAVAWEKIRELRYQTDLIAFPKSATPTVSVWRIVRKPIRMPTVHLVKSDKILLCGIAFLMLVVFISNLIASL